ncbi:hypothetical protein SAMN05444365_102154 [Micromonospora pattaloongensis]|uniref:Magnesium transporter NIPA n=1 Tax=Micromonospora pattaloongensis TaxID=405436 RepID=A0A1H3JK14_9ACTN|nr:DMT family transporter [Micromonospora pattaloongensis]SDY40303.1 hypothetical protein SAMN05444365_102154 [Micromonospora pattaloongensis]
MILAVGLAVVAAFCFALASALHQKAAKQQQPHAALDPRLLLRLLRSPLWLWAWVPDTAGVALQALALRFGTLVTVQPVLSSGLLMAVLIEARLNRRRVLRRDLVAVVLGAAGLAAFVAVAGAQTGQTDPPASRWWAPGLAAVSVVAASALVSRWLHGAARGALLGFAGGVAYSLTAALVKAVLGHYHGDLLTAVVDWRVAALAGSALTGLLLTQNAFQSGRLAAPLTALTLTDPVVSVLLGVIVFDETIALTGPKIAGLAAASAAIVAGIWLAGKASAASQGSDAG